MLVIIFRKYCANVLNQVIYITTQYFSTRFKQKNVFCMKLITPNNRYVIMKRSDEV